MAQGLKNWNVAKQNASKVSDVKIMPFFTRKGSHDVERNMYDWTSQSNGEARVGILIEFDMGNSSQSGSALMRVSMSDEAHIVLGLISQSEMDSGIYTSDYEFGAKIDEQQMKTDIVNEILKNVTTLQVEPKAE